MSLQALTHQDAVVVAATPDSVYDLVSDVTRTGEGSPVCETWEFLPAGQAVFADKYGDRAEAEIEDRTRHAHAGIPKTLAAIKRIAEGG